MPSVSFASILNHSVKILRRAEGAVDSYGHPAITAAVLVPALSVYLYALSGEKRRREYGQEKLGDFRMLAYATSTLQEHDWVEPVVGIAGFTRAEVLWVQTIPDLVGATHHMEVELRSF